MKHIIMLGLLISALLANSAHSFEVAVDPVPFLLKGYSLSLAQNFGDKRFEIGIFGLEADDDIHGNDNFDMEFEGFGIKYDHLFNHYEGVFIGWELNFADVTYTHTKSNEVFDRTVITTAPRIGYRFVKNNNFTITPWLALDILLYDGDKVESQGDTYETDEIQLFPSIQFGYKF
ncbi:hypothetical protein [Marinomonas sp. PE14-40]|uniref:hypothetical protein n=1 Tax=Marinomonas sp. PE14-40 TaxID=3060621 RepID=UPI003F668DBE